MVTWPLSASGLFDDWVLKKEEYSMWENAFSEKKKKEALLKCNPVSVLISRQITGPKLLLSNGLSHGPWWTIGCCPLWYITLKPGLCQCFGMRGEASIMGSVKLAFLKSLSGLFSPKRASWLNNLLVSVLLHQWWDLPHLHRQTPHCSCTRYRAPLGQAASDWLEDKDSLRSSKAPHRLSSF